MIQRLLPFVLALSAGALPASAPASGQAGTVTEKQTKVRFQQQLRIGADADAVTLALVGTAVRDKRVVFNFDVYAYGLYLDAEAAPGALAAWKQKSAAALSKDEKFYAELCKDNFAKTLRLVFVRSVDGEDVEEAFRESIAPRIEKARAKMEMPDAKKELAAFRAFFANAKFEEGDEILLTWLPGNELATRVKGKDQALIVSPALCWALFDVYLGKDPIEEKGRQTVVALVPKLLG